MKTMPAVTAAVAVLAMSVPAQAAAPLPGKYTCSAVLGSTTLASSGALRLKASGRYKVGFSGYNGASSSGTWKKKGKELHFKGGLLGGDVATRKAHPIQLASVQLAFKSFHGQKRISCLR